MQRGRLSRAILLLLAIGAAFPNHAQAQTNLETFRVYTDHPRLFLRPQRLRLLRRERERNSMRWEQFHLLLAGGAPMPEPGWAHALAYRISDEKAEARKAIEAALSPNTDVRQIALVYDWCQDQLTAAEERTLIDRLRAGLLPQRSTVIPDLRAQVLAAVALAGDDDAASESALTRFVKENWLGKIIPAMKNGDPVIGAGDTYALFEIFHALRDNLNVDLRDDNSPAFRQLPLFDLLSYYPPPYPASENEFHIPYSPNAKEPDLRAAALSRAGELAMVAYDTNAPESQVLQGWLMNDRFLMRGPFGIPYEFLWANPYQPGLSYYHVPLVLHDELFGRLLVRSSWEDDAVWAGFIGGHLQQFRDGRVVPIDLRGMRAPLDLDEAQIFFARTAMRLQSGAKKQNDIFVVGLEPRAPYHVEIDDEDMVEIDSDPGGILYFKALSPSVSVRWNRRSTGTGSPASTSR